MKNLQMLTLAYLICLSLLPAISGAQDGDPIIFYRDGNGEVNRASQADAKVMARIARRQGYINLFLTSDFPFNLNFDEMTPDEIEDQNNRAADYLADTLSAAIASGLVWHPPEGETVYGPGCKVQAAPTGLRVLLRDERFVQVVALELRPNER